MSGAPVESVESFVRYYRRIRQRTRRVADLIPDDRIEWAPREDKFTFGDLLRHLAGLERHMFAENARRRPSRYPGHDRTLADGKAAVLAYMDRLHEESMAILSALDAEDWVARCTTPGGAELAVWKWLRAMIEHEVHHRGQIYLMLGLLDVPTPPLYGLTAEEVLERSRA